jgi:hypothetical protein
MLFATAVMGAACWAARLSPLYRYGTGRAIWFEQLLLVTLVGAVVYLGVCRMLGVDMLQSIRRKPKGG